MKSKSCQNCERNGGPKGPMTLRCFGCKCLTCGLDCDRCPLETEPNTEPATIEDVRKRFNAPEAHAWAPQRLQGRWIVSRWERPGDYPTFNPDGWFSLSVGEHETEQGAIDSAMERPLTLDGATHAPRLETP